MDYEKLHKDTITKLQEMVNSGKITVETACGICADFVPESEDEKMMNQLHSWMKEFGGAEEYTEKVYQWIKGLLKKRGEHTFTLGEEDEKIRKELIDYINSEYRHTLDLVRKNKFIAWLEKQGEQKPAEWSEVDEKCIRDSIFYLKSAKKYFEKDNDILWDEKWFNLCIELLESLYKRLQPQQWSEEDEREVAVLEAYIRSKDWSERHIDSALGIVDELVNKAKSLRTQNTWKPSDEQMTVLSTAMCGVNDPLFSLYQDLKKLREE